MNEEIKESKQLLRKKIRQLLNQQNDEFLRKASPEILDNLLKLPAWAEADIILAYLPMKDEVNTIPFIEAALASGKKAAVPRIDGDDIIFHFIDSLSPASFEKHEYGMPEPPASSPVFDTASINEKNVLILVPGLAFDQSCRRLGRGKSFYDRFLSACMHLSAGSQRFIKAGISFHLQIADAVPVEEHDVILDYVITEKAVYSSLKR